MYLDIQLKCKISRIEFLEYFRSAPICVFIVTVTVVVYGTGINRYTGVEHGYPSSSSAVINRGYQWNLNTGKRPSITSRPLIHHLVSFLSFCRDVILLIRI